VLIPALGSGIDLPSLLDACDGLLLTERIECRTHHYGGPASEPGTLHDPNRDARTLVDSQATSPPACRAGDMPGIQEMNVAYGGTLHQGCMKYRNNLDHREDESTPLGRAIRAGTRSLLEPGGALRKIVDGIACRSIL